MRKVSILLVGLMLIAGLAVGSSAVTNPTDASGISADVNMNASLEVNTIVALYVHSDVSFDQIDSSDVSFDGSGNFTNLSELTVSNNTIKAFANTDLAVTVSASNTGGQNFDFTRFKIKGGDLGSWTPFESNGSAQTPTVLDKGPGLHTASVDYKYIPNETDSPGSYTAQLTYTVSSG